jgi:amino-acid N-acetyltransferase
VSAVVHRAIIHPPNRTRTIGPATILRPTLVRSATADDVEAIHQLIASHATEGRLLSRSIDEIGLHIGRFIVATRGTEVIGCVDLAPLSASLAEVRSLVVDAHFRAAGVGRRLLREVTARAAAAGFETLCAFTHSPGYFVQAGFSIVPHAWLPEKIEHDCRHCSLFRTCGQYAVALPLRVAASFVEVGTVNG